MGKKKAKQSVQACSDKKSKGKKEIVEQSGLTAPKKLVMKSDLTPSKK